MKDYKKRLFIEKDELFIKTEKLSDFVLGPSFAELSEIKKNLLSAQLTAMLTYGSILEMRIDI